MNQEQLQQKIAEYFEKLPKEAQDVFSSMGWMEILKNIDTKYSLNNNQIEILGAETTLVLLGIIHVEEYKKILEKELELEKEITEKIIIEINETILKTIKEGLSKTFEANAISLAEKEAPVVEKKPEFDPRFLNMPKDVEEAIALSNWKENLYKIAQKHKLTVEQMGVLEEVTIKVIKNEIHPDKYEEELASKITIAKEDISNLVKDVNEEILKKIRESMRNQKNEEEIPLPPYAKLINNDQLIINNEKEIPKQVEKLEELIIPKPIEPTPETIIPPKNIMEEKLKSATVSDHTISDYSSPKTHDPYREVF